MKQLHFVMPVLMLALLFVNAEKNVEPFRWLEGTWSMKMKRGTIIETWQKVNDSSLVGSSKMSALSGDERVLENLELVYTSGIYYYVSAVNGQNNNQPVRFRITSYSEGGFVAENPEHDFPKRITYQLINKDSVHAFIDGGPQQPEKKSDFYYSRTKN